MSGQVLDHVRVSRIDQDSARQVEAIEDVTDHLPGASGAHRAALPSLMRHARSGDSVRVTSIDLLARSAVDLAAVVTELTSRGVRVEFIAEHLAFDSRGADAFAAFQLHLLGAVARLERSLIRERQREGIARTHGVCRGRARRLDAAIASTGAHASQEDRPERNRI